MVPHAWSKVPEENQTADPRGRVQKNWNANSMGASVRGLMATAACARDDAIGTLVATLGASNVYAVATNEGLIDPLTQINGLTPAITKPFALRLAFGTALTGSATNVPHLKVDGFDCGPILRRDGSPLIDGDLNAKGPVWVLGEFAAATDTKVTQVRVMDPVASDIAALIPQQSSQIGGLLVYANPNLLVLKRETGTRMPINGVPQPIPTDGVAFAPSGASSALLFAYVYMNGSGLMSGEVSATPPDISLDTGIRIKQGDPSRTLVGATVTTGSGTFRGGCCTLSFYNRRDLCDTTGQINPGTSASQWSILSGSLLYGLCWADEAIDAEFTGSGGIGNFNAGLYANLRTIVGDQAVSNVFAAGPQSRAGGQAYVAGGLASRVVTRLGGVQPFAVWAQGYGDTGLPVGYLISGTLKTRG